MSRRVAWVALLVSAVLTGSAVGVAGQSQDAAATAFTGRAHELGDDCGKSSTFEIVGGVEQVRGYRCEQWMGTTDPRFTGTYVRFGNTDSYRHDDVAPQGGSFGVYSVVLRVENDEGAWHADATYGAWGQGLFEEGEVIFADEIVVFTGEGEYEGLTAVVWLQPQLIDTPVRGVVFAGAPPPAARLSGLAESDQRAP